MTSQMRKQARKEERKKERRESRAEQKEKIAATTATSNTAVVAGRRRSTNGASPLRYSAALSRGLIWGGLIALLVVVLSGSLDSDASSVNPAELGAKANVAGMADASQAQQGSSIPRTPGGTAGSEGSKARATSGGASSDSATKGSGAAAVKAASRKVWAKLRGAAQKLQKTTTDVIATTTRSKA